MIVLAIVATLAAVVWSFFVLFANSMRSSPGEFQGVGIVAAAWLGVAVMWLAWGFG
jgi:hypothetical protein